MADPVVPTPESVTASASVTTLVMTSLLGLTGSVLSLLFGGHDLRAWGRVGCLLAGLSCAVVFGPLVTVAWHDCPAQVLSAFSFILGLSGLFLVRGLLSVAKQFETQMPWLARVLFKAKTGIELPAGEAPAGPKPPPPSPDVTGGPP